MSSPWLLYGLLAVNTIALFSLGVLAAVAASNISGSTNDPNIVTAHSYLSGAAIAGIVAAVILIIVSIIYAVSLQRNVTLILFLIGIAIIGLIIMGILAALASGSISASGTPTGSVATARTYAIYVAVISILLFLMMLVLFYVMYQSRFIRVVIPTRSLVEYGPPSQTTVTTQTTPLPAKVALPPVKGVIPPPSEGSSEEIRQLKAEVSRLQSQLELKKLAKQSNGHANGLDVQAEVSVVAPGRPTKQPHIPFNRTRPPSAPASMPSNQPPAQGMETDLSTLAPPLELS